MQYEVKWLGWDEGHITWELLANVGNAQELIEEFHKEHLDAVTKADIPPPKLKKKKKSRR